MTHSRFGYVAPSVKRSILDALRSIKAVLVLLSLVSPIVLLAICVPPLLYLYETIARAAKAPSVRRVRITRQSAGAIT